MTILNLGCGPHLIEGAVNLDKQTGWVFEDGLMWGDGAVDGITISHALMFVRDLHWPFIFGEFARVLRKDGIIRITEDATDDPASPRFGGFDGAVTLTSFTLVEQHLRAAGLVPYWMPPDESLFADKSLIQNHHGRPPKVFYIEGLKA